MSTLDGFASPTPGGSLRIGHTEREAAVEVLREAAGDGRITLDELDARIERALAARFAADLTVLVADLVPDPGVVLRRAGEVVIPGAPGSSWENPLVFTARWDDIKRAGTWDVPPFLELHAIAGNVKLDFVDAHISSKVVDVSVVGGAGDVVIIVPEGMGVDVAYLQSRLGGVRSRVAPRPGPGGVQLIVRGELRVGDVKVRHPNSLDRWQRERRLARGGGPEIKN